MCVNPLGVNTMLCYRCNAELKWESDSDVEDNENYHAVTFLSCQSCGVWTEVYIPIEEKPLHTDQHKV